MLTRSRTLPSRAYNGVVEERQDIRLHLQVEVQPKAQQESEAKKLQANYAKCFDDDGRLKRTGTFWTATSHIITAVIGSSVLSLACAIGQLGWIAGPAVMILFAIVNLLPPTYCHSATGVGILLLDQEIIHMDAVKANLGQKVKVCGLIQYINLFGVAIGYTIAASVSMMAIERSNCFHKSKGKDPCHMSSNGYMITFGIIEIIFSQIPDFDQVWWLSMVAATTSFTYSTVGLALGIAKVAENGSFKGSLTGISIGTLTHAGTVTATHMLWRSLQALGAIAFAYSYSIILIEIQDAIKSPPAEYKTMKKATSLSINITTIFYLLCGCMGYAAFGDDAPGNLLTGFGFYDPYWLLDIANVGIVIHLVGAYQVYCQPLFALVEKWSGQRWLVWRNAFVILTTIITILLPFFNDVVGILGALGFWPLTVYFPIEMYLSSKKIGRWTNQWIGLQLLSAACLLVSLAAAVGSVAGVVLDLRTYKPPLKLITK